jgi:hypothetical protein
MALFNTTTIKATYLPVITTAGSSYLDDYLAFVTEYLEKKGLIFVATTPSVTTDQIELDDNYISLVTVPNFFNISPAPIIRLKCHDGGSQDDLLVESIDYTLSQLNCKSKPVYQINLLKKKISAPHYLEVTAKFYFGLETDLPQDIKMAVIEEFLGLYENFLLHQKKAKSNGQTVTAVQMGSVRTQFATDSGSSNSIEFTTKRLDKVLSFYNL